MPDGIKVNNTMALTALIEATCEKLQLKPSTKAGAGLTVYVNAMLDQATDEGIDYVRRNLDRAIELLTAMREAPHAEAMNEAADAIAKRHTAEVLERDKR